MQQKRLFAEGIVLTPSTLKQLSMIGKVNPPFKMIQVVFKKGVSKEANDGFRSSCDDSGSKLVYVSREYDGSERFMLLYPAGTSIDFFPTDKNIIVLS